MRVSVNATHNGTHSTHKAQSRVSPHCMVINKMYIDAMGLLTVKHAMMSLWAGTGIQKPRVKSNVKYWAGASPPQKQQKYRVENWGGGHLLTLVLYIYTWSMLWPPILNDEQRVLAQAKAQTLHCTASFSYLSHRKIVQVATNRELFTKHRRGCRRHSWVADRYKSRKTLTINYSIN